MTPFLQFCDLSVGEHELGTIKRDHYKFMHYWKKYSNASGDQLPGFETDNYGNNALHLSIKRGHVFGVQYILETVFFSHNNSKKNKKGFGALNQQNNDGDSPLHAALTIVDGEIAADIVKILLKYDCDVARTYNKEGCLPIHVACINNNWEALALLIQKRLYGEDSDDINETTNTINQDTALSLSIAKKLDKCVRALCQNKNIHIDDMSFFHAIQSNNEEILKYLLNARLNKDNVFIGNRLIQVKVLP